MKHISPKSRQTGAALVVGLMLLLVLTLLAVSSMNTASTELAMAGNAQYQQNAFQAAESGIEQALRNGAFVPGAVETPVTGSVGTDTYSATVNSQVGGAPQPALWGNSWDSFSTYHFEISSIGNSVRSSRANNFQGAAVIAPADSTVGATGSTTALE